MDTSRTTTVLAASVLLGAAALATAPAAAAHPAAEPVTINVLSDVQGDLADFGAVLDAYASFPAADHMVVNGDLVPNGREAEYEAFFAVLGSREHPPASYTIGNHEFYSGASSEVHVERFLRHTGMPRVHHTVMAGDVPVVHIGSLANPGRWAVGNQVELGAEQLAWLDAELDRFDADRPVLVFGHHPLPHSVSGTVGEGRQDYYDLDYAEADQLLAILGDHPNVVFFSGHTHYSLERDDWMNRVVVEGGAAEGFLAVNTGAVQTEWGPNPGGPNRGEWSGPSSFKQALRVTVDGSEVEVTSLDFATGSAIRAVTVDVAGDLAPVEDADPVWPGDPLAPEPGADGALAAKRAEVRHGKKAEFSYTTDLPDRGNQVVVYPAGEITDDTEPVLRADASRAEGKVKFSTGDLTPGEYTAYLVTPQGRTSLADPVAFTVVDR
ncbi:DUF4073 domain-containing protein [Thermobifida halotolerans]|uniref:DUF4073 domain-containing protein n=1 Tax=Thermobifida halotolerans TaxID=483545 RepID=A0AA97LZH2_9ACTN|nr:DUF4073 domain-containing protein [Thermobifida halotolerans]UOE21157.1 DUF4073 domain-containing protein [Thermobifida halotolerans]